MSVFKRKGSEVYSYDFQVRGRRFSGNTEATNKKDGEAIERGLKAKAKADVEADCENSATRYVAPMIATPEDIVKVASKAAFDKALVMNVQRAVLASGRHHFLRRLNQA